MILEILLSFNSKSIHFRIKLQGSCIYKKKKKIVSTSFTYLFRKWNVCCDIISLFFTMFFYSKKLFQRMDIKCNHVILTTHVEFSSFLSFLTFKRITMVLTWVFHLDNIYIINNVIPGILNIYFLLFSYKFKKH